MENEIGSRDSEYEIPVPGAEEITEIGHVTPNPEAGNLGSTIAEVKREEDDDKKRKEEVEKIIEKRDRKIH